VVRIRLAQDNEQRRAFARSNETSSSIKCLEFLIQLYNY
jgi:hypothetical protein